MPVAELLAKIQVLPRAARLRLVREIVTSLIEEEDEFPVNCSSWRASLKALSALMPATMRRMKPSSVVTMKNDSDFKPEYDFKTLRKADPARHRAILARGASSAAVQQEDGSVTVITLEPDPRALRTRLEPDVAKAFPTAELAVTDAGV